MPELNNIESYTKLTEEAFAEKIARIEHTASYVPNEFQIVFKDWLKSIRYPKDENADHGWSGPKLRIGLFKIFPTIMIWSPTHHPVMKTAWLAYGLHFETEQILMPNERKYTPAATGLLGDLFLKMAITFDDFPTLLTDEADDGQIWFQSVGFERAGKPSRMFDLAFLPRNCKFDRSVLVEGKQSIPSEHGELIINPNRFEWPQSLA